MENTHESGMVREKWVSGGVYDRIVGGLFGSSGLFWNMHDARSGRASTNPIAASLFIIIHLLAHSTHIR
jgi:hypothetical protein